MLCMVCVCVPWAHSARPCLWFSPHECRRETETDRLPSSVQMKGQSPRLQWMGPVLASCNTIKSVKYCITHEDIDSPLALDEV